MMTMMYGGGAKTNQQSAPDYEKLRGKIMPTTLLRTVFLALSINAFACASASAAPVVLPQYNVSFSDVSVSGVSSGGYMAAQMHFAYSGTIKKGAGIIAGGPVYCSQGVLKIATGPCMADTGSRNLPHLIEKINTWSGNGYIDPVANLPGSKAYLFSGTADSTVKQPVMDDLNKMYLNFIGSANVRYSNNVAAEHAMPTDDYGNACTFKGSPYINACKVDAAGEILKWIHGPLKPANNGAPGGSFINFDQRAYWADRNPARHGMANDGWAYIPADCAAGQPCKLHVAFHGCQQNAATIGDRFYKNAGYNKWADTNNIVVLYPQAKAILANPNGCWDWWGYDDVNFPGKSGGQMVAIKAMIDRIASNNAAVPFTCSDWRTDNYAHVREGRAYVFGWRVHAVNSNQYLGYHLPFLKSSVRQTSPGYYAGGSCP
jgi:poly(3-hydroxybutyrate) depolymerase